MIWFVLFALVLVAVIIVVLGPLFLGQREDWDVDTSPKAFQALREQKDQTLRMLKDLDLERESGAVNEKIYEEMRARFLDEAALINRRLKVLAEARSQMRDQETPPDPESQGSPTSANTHGTALDDAGSADTEKQGEASPTETSPQPAGETRSDT